MNQDSVIEVTSNIMIVDDQPANLKVLSEILKESGYVVRPVPSGKLALSAAVLEAPDLFLLDIMMPEMDGYETCRRLKEIPVIKDIPVIFISALDNTDGKVKGFEAGGVDYITKPFESTEVLMRVDKHLELHNLQKKLEFQNNELLDTLEKLQNTQQRLIEFKKMAALGSVVIGIAHEINTPVGNGLTASSFLKKIALNTKAMFDSKEIDNSAMQDYMTQIVDSTDIVYSSFDRVAKLIEKFKLISVDQPSENILPFNVLNQINKSVFALAPTLKEPAISLCIDCDPHAELVSDPNAITQVIEQLLENTMKHAYPQAVPGKIAIRYEQHESEDTLIFSDDGKGIDPIIMQNLFDPFITTNRGADGGSGLGLHIVYNTVVWKLQGTIDCKSTLGNGATFTITIPKNRT